MPYRTSCINVRTQPPEKMNFAVRQVVFRDGVGRKCQLLPRFRQKERPAFLQHCPVMGQACNKSGQSEPCNKPIENSDKLSGIFSIRND